MTQKEQNAFDIFKGLLIGLDLPTRSNEYQKIVLNDVLETAFKAAELFEQKREENRNKLTNKTQ